MTSTGGYDSLTGGCDAEVGGKALWRQAAGNTSAVADGQRFSIYRA